MASYTLARLGYMLLFSRADVQSGYVLLIYVYLILQVWLWIRRLPHYQSRWLWLLILCFGFVGVGRRGYVAYPVFERVIEQNAETEIQFARRIDSLLPKEGALFGGYYGIMGYFTERPWVNLDGVVNTYEYQEIVRDQKLGAYFDNQNIRYAVFFHRAELPAEGTIPFVVPTFMYYSKQVIDIPINNIVIKTKLADRKPNAWLLIAELPEEID